MSGLRVLFFSAEPGGAAVLAPAAELARREGFDVVVAGRGLGTGVFKRRGLACEEIGSDADAPSLLEKHRPRALVTSAASLPGRDRSERLLWAAARRAGIPSLAMLDQWQNYAERFSGPSPSERLAFLPDAINALNAVGREEMLAEGFPAEKLLTLGHPALSELPARAAAADPAAARAHLGLGSGPVLLFISEPLREHFGDLRGYDQYGVLQTFVADAARLFPAAQVLVKLHPKDDLSRYAFAADAGARLAGGDAAPLDCLLCADAVFGMSSVMLLEAFALGKPVASLQPGLKGPDPLVLSRRGLIPRADSLAALGRLPAAPDPARFDARFNEAGFLAWLKERARP